MGLLKTAAKVAVASHVHGRVQRRQRERWASQDAAATADHVAVQPPAPAVPQVDPLARLAQLGELRAAGVLTDAEFEAQKAKILAG